MKRVAGDEVDVHLADTASSLNVDVGAERIERLFVNLASYGRERMPFGGQLKIELGTTVVDRRFAAKHPNVRLGPHALITVTENRRAEQANPFEKSKANHIVDRILRLEPEAASRQMAQVLEHFDGRHRNLIDIFETRAAEMEEVFDPHAALSQTQRRLIGAYFLNEYSFEASALFNPSIVRHPDQTGAPKNGCRFILSLRAVGEGHISSLTFRSGSIAADGSVTVDPAARLASSLRFGVQRPGRTAKQSTWSSARTTSSANA